MVSLERSLEVVWWMLECFRYLQMIMFQVVRHYGLPKALEDKLKRSKKYLKHSKIHYTTSTPFVAGRGEVRGSSARACSGTMAGVSPERTEEFRESIQRLMRQGLILSTHPFISRKKQLFCS